MKRHLSTSPAGSCLWSVLLYAWRPVPMSMCDALLDQDPLGRVVQRANASLDLPRDVHAWLVHAIHGVQCTRSFLQHDVHIVCAPTLAKSILSLAWSSYSTAEDHPSGRSRTETYPSIILKGEEGAKKQASIQLRHARVVLGLPFLMVWLHRRTV